jgi:hypothetical protein
MGDNRQAAHPVVCADEADGALELTAGVLRAPERWIVLGRLVHLRIGIGELAEPVEVERPRMKSTRHEFIAPGTPVEAMSDRQRRRKCRPMDVEDNATIRHRAVIRGQIA